MPSTANELITKAYYLSGIVSREFQAVSGAQLTDGLALLNDLLAVKGIRGSLLPYFKEYSFNAVVGQEKYFVPGLMQAETLTFFIDTVRYQTFPRSRRRYFGDSRADDIQSLPYTWHVERTLNGADVYLYFKPDTNYPIKIWGKFMLDSVVDPCADLSLIYDRFYLTYLRYALSSYIAEENDETVPDNVMKKLRSLELQILDLGTTDLTTRTISIFNQQGVINYGQVNLGRGWIP